MSRTQALLLILAAAFFIILIYVVSHLTAFGPSGVFK